METLKTLSDRCKTFSKGDFSNIGNFSNLCNFGNLNIYNLYKGS